MDPLIVLDHPLGLRAQVQAAVVLRQTSLSLALRRMHQVLRFEVRLARVAVLVLPAQAVRH